MESTKAKKGKLEQFRVSIALLIAGILFLIGIGVMSMVLNNVESLHFSVNTNRINTRKLSAPDTAFEYIVSYLNDNEHHDLPFTFDGKPLKDMCDKVVGVSLTRVNHTDNLVNDGRFTFDVEGKVECKVDAQAGTKMFDVKGTFEVLQKDKQFTLSVLPLSSNFAIAN